MEFNDDLSAGITALGLTVSLSQQENLCSYARLLEKWNRAYNLVASVHPQDILYKHLLDSLAISSALEGATIIDVGSGAGLPGIPLAITNPHRQFHLLDANGKKTRFMQQAVIELNLTNVQVIQARAESYQPLQAYSCVVTRAFSPLPEAMKILPNLCADNGTVLIMTGQKPTRIEVPASLAHEMTQELNIPGLDAQRHLIKLRKI